MKQTPVGVIRLAGRGKYNLLTSDALSRAARDLEAVADQNPAVVVLLGAEHFSAGADLEEIGGMSASAFTDLLDAELDLCERIESLPCPTIAGLRGRCQGSAAEIVLACDFRLADTTLRFALPEVSAGFPAPVHRLARHVPIGLAKEILLGGRSLTADEAMAAGLIQEMFSEGELSDGLDRWTDRLSRLNSRAVQTTKQWLAEAYRGQSLDRDHLRSISRGVFDEWQRANRGSAMKGKS